MVTCLVISDDEEEEEEKGKDEDEKKVDVEEMLQAVVDALPLPPCTARGTLSPSTWNLTEAGLDLRLIIRWYALPLATAFGPV
jgi:hypothetical protein